MATSGIEVSPNDMASEPDTRDIDSSSNSIVLGEAIWQVTQLRQNLVIMGMLLWLNYSWRRFLPKAGSGACRFLESEAFAIRIPAWTTSSDSTWIFEIKLVSDTVKSFFCTNLKQHVMPLILWWLCHLFSIECSAEGIGVEHTWPLKVVPSIEFKEINAKRNATHLSWMFVSKHRHSHRIYRGKRTSGCVCVGSHHSWKPSQCKAWRAQLVCSSNSFSALTTVGFYWCAR